MLGQGGGGLNLPLQLLSCAPCGSTCDLFRKQVTFIFEKGKQGGKEGECSPQAVLCPQVWKVLSLFALVGWPRGGVCPHPGNQPRSVLGMGTGGCCPGGRVPFPWPLGLPLLFDLLRKLAFFVTSSLLEDPGSMVAFNFGL